MPNLNDQNLILGLFKTIPKACLLIEPHSSAFIIVQANQRFKELLNIKNDLNGKEFSDLFKDLNVKADFNKVFSTIKKTKQEQQLQIDHFNYLFCAVWDQKLENIIYLIAYVDRLVNHHQVNYPQNLLASIINSSDDAILSKTLDGIITSWNKGAEIIFGYKDHEIVGRHISTLIPEKLLKEEVMIIDKIKKGEHITHYETERLHKNGKFIQLSITVSPIYNEKGEIIGASKIGRDITEKIKSENIIKENIQRFEYVAKATSEAIWDWDLREETFYWGEGFESIFGYKFNENGTDISSWTKHIHPDDADRVIKGIFKVINSDETNWGDEYRYQYANGKYAQVVDKGFVIRDAKGKALRMVGALIDITKKNKDKERLNLLESTIININDAVLITEADVLVEPGPTIIYVNHAFTKMTGYTSEEAIGRSPRFLQGADTERKKLDIISTALKMQQPCEVTILNYKKNGEAFWSNISISPLFDERGICSHFIAIQKDVTIQINNVKLQQEAYEEKRNILESIGDGFIAVDKNWMVTYWNRQAEILLQINKEDIIGKKLWDVYKKSDAKTYQIYLNALEHNKAEKFEHFNEALNKWFDINVYPSKNGLSISFKDISAKKLIEFELLQLNENLKQKAHELAISNSELEQFAYIASHDLQEPLRMITGFLSQLDKKYSDVIDERGKKYIDFAVDGANRMRQIILDLLEFSRVGKSDEQKVELNLNDLIGEIKILLRKKILDKKAVIKTTNLPVIKNFRSPIVQIFQNLIDNALKYSRENVTAIINVSCNDLNTHWEFEINDNGIGISEEYFEKIFVIFQRLHLRDEYSGTGMGLAITKKIVESLGGKISLSSKPGEGTTFTFTIKKYINTL